MEETTESLLNEWGMSEIQPDCERLGIDIEALRYMQEDDLQILIPSYRLGVRIKLRQRLKEWKERKGYNTILNGFHIANSVDDSQLLEESPPPKKARRTYNDIKSIQDDTYDSDVLSDSNYDPLQDFDQNSENDEQMPQTETQSEASNAQKAIRKALLSGNTDDSTNQMPDVDDQSRRSKFTVWNTDGLASFDLDAVLASTHKGQCVREYFDKHKKLDSESRRYLTDCVCEHLVNVNQRMTHSEMDQVADEIIRRFPTELKETYYIPRDKNNPLPRGKLRNKFNNCVRLLRLKGLRGLKAGKKRPSTNKSRAKVIEPEIEHDNSNVEEDIDENMIDIKVWLKSNFEPWEKVKAKWKITSEKRVQFFHRKLLTDLTATLHEWPTLTKLRGYECIEIDFDTLYPNRVDFISNKWNDFIVRFMTKCSKDIKDPPSKSLLNDIAMNRDIAEDPFNCIIFCLLGSILRRGHHHKNRNGEFLKPNITDIQNCLVLHVPVIELYHDVLDKYVKRCKDLEIGYFPAIIAVGSELRNTSVYYVHFENCNYKFSNFLQAMTICFKMFHVLNILYPKPTENVWSFIQKYFFDITTSRDVSSIAISAFLSDLMN